MDSFLTPQAGQQPAATSRPETLGALLQCQAALCPERMAYAMLDDNLEVEQSLTFGEVATMATALGQALLQHAQPGDRVLLAYNNGIEAIQAFWGCMAAGLIPVPAPAPESGHSRVALSRLTGIAADAQISLALTSDEAVESARAQAAELSWSSVAELLSSESTDIAAQKLPPAPQTESLAYLQYTSGSTSEPRGVEITHAAVLAQCLALEQATAVDRDHDRGLIWLPWFHDYGLVHALILPVYHGVSSFLMPTLSFVRRPLRWLTAIEKHRVTHIGAPNFAFAACTQALARNKKWSGNLTTLRVASCGAEPVRRDTLDDFAAAFAPHGFSPDALTPSYGLAEAVLVVSLTRNGPRYLRVQSRALEQHQVEVVPSVNSAQMPAGPTDATTQLVSCGLPLQGFEVCIVDPEKRAVCVDAQVGEIWVNGPSLGRGYWGNSTATAKDFHAHLSGDPGRSFLRTGDLGFLHDGEVYVTGRLKDLLVVHGRNVYPQDLEQTAETSHDAVRAAGVIAVTATRDDGQESAVLLVECRGRPTPEVVADIVEAARRSVATEHEIDVLEVVPLRSGTLPRTSSGKPRRAAALSMYQKGEFAARRIATAESPNSETALITAPDSILKTVQAVWSEVLAVPEPEPHADFFAQGGDSLLATQIVSRLNAQLDIELSVRAVFEASNPAELARLAHAAEAAVEAPVLRPLATDAPQRLSFTQERMWFMHQLAPESSAYNVPMALRLKGALDKDALQEALNSVVGRHRILQTGFKVAEAEPLGFVPSAQGEAGPAVRIYDIDLRTENLSQEAIDETLTGLVSQPFKLDNPPLLRVSLVHVSHNEAILVCVMHHIVGDQWSCAVLGRELAAAYSAVVKAMPAEQPDMSRQYADFAEWQRRWFSGARLQQQLTYWKEQLAGVEPLQLNEDFPRARQQGFRGASVRRPLDATRLERLSKLAADNGASLSMVLIAALKVLLMRHTGSTDIAIGVPVANRNHLSTESLIGSFVNTLVFRTDLSGGPDFLETLRRVREVSLQAFSNQDMPFELLVRELDLPHDTSHSPLFDVIFNMINTPVGDVEFPGLTWSRHEFDRGAAQFDLTVSADALYDPAIVFEYATDLFARDTIENLADHFFRILDTATAAPATVVSDIPLLSDAERQRLQDWGQSRLPEGFVNAPSVSEQIAARAQQNPSAPAVICGETVRSYAELDAAANRLAAELRARGITRGSTVGLCLSRSVSLPEVLVGTVRSGATYVPLDPGYPRERLRFQAKDANLDLLVTDEQSIHALELSAETTLLLDRDAARIADRSAAALLPDLQKDADLDDPAYIIYTSGSTGVPKGVSVPHRAVVNFLGSMQQQPGLNADDRLLAVTTLGFDIALLELLLPLTVGACVVIARDTEAGDGAALARLISQHDISVMQATPSRWRMLIAADWDGADDLKALVGGEALTSDLAMQLLDRCEELWNMYGPTETTVWSSCWQVPPNVVEPVSLGQPIAATTLQVLDESGHLCPTGVPGELCIGGRGLALGYLNQPDLTERQFVTAGDHAAFPAMPIYRTGDRARWCRNGRLEHLGRFDSQIKLRGYRIESGEIEAHLLRHESVSEALVLVHDEGQDAQLVAYVVSQGMAPDQAADVWRSHLRQWLPEHMVPEHFLALDALPVLPNGKIDYRALPAPVKSDLSRGIADRAETVIEHALLAIWQSALQRHDFGVRDNFFDLGGHSMLAVHLVQRIAEELRVDCPLTLLFQYPTVAELGAALQSGHADLREGAAAQLLAVGSGRPLFCLAGMQIYSDLAAQFPSGTKIFGLLSEAEAELFQHGTRLPDIPELAASYRRTMQRLQPKGPYRLTGFSIGGVIAFEVARQLREAGEQVELLALLDSAAPGFGLAHAKRWLKHTVIQLWRRGLRYLRPKGVELSSSTPAQRSGTQEPNKLRSKTVAVYPEFARVIRRYQAGHWQEPMLFLQAADDPIQELGYGWLLYAPELTAERIPGEHMDMLHGAAAGLVAERLQHEFDKVSGRSPTSTELRYSSTVESP